MSANQILFLSDFHLGVPNHLDSLEREKRICALLNLYASKVTDIFFVGDIFDFWFEYNTVAPKGYYRLLGKLAELSDLGIQLHFFKGNHDMWMRDLFNQEFKAKIYTQPITLELNGKKIYIGHGDGLGPGDFKYKLLKKFFASSICQFLYRWIHPDIGMAIANYFSFRSRYSQPLEPEKYLGNNREWLYLFCREELKKTQPDFFIFGHRHLAIYQPIENTKSIYINLGDWLVFNTYAVFDGNEVSLYQYDTDKKNSDFTPSVS